MNVVDLLFQFGLLLMKSSWKTIGSATSAGLRWCKTMERECWLCGRRGSQDPLDRHHIFGGAYRNKSERYGLVVYLCHNRCHIFGKDAVHNNAETMQMVREYGQRKAMEEQGWTVEQFQNEFGKNYLEEDN